MKYKECENGKDSVGCNWIFEHNCEDSQWQNTMMIVLLLFLQKQNLANAIYLSMAFPAAPVSGYRTNYYKKGGALVPIPNRYTAKAKLCFCKNNKRMIIRDR